MKQQGFTIPAAGNFIAQHSFTCDDYPVGRGRPDGDDLEKAAEFGRVTTFRINKGVEDITCMYKGNMYIRMYVSGPADSPGFVSFGEAFRSGIKVSDHGEDLCEECGQCVQACPTGSIDAQSFRIADESCIRCFACTSVCPAGVKKKVVHPAENLAAWFTHRASERGEPLLFA
jgi:ferredoxin